MSVKAVCAWLFVLFIGIGMGCFMKRSHNSEPVAGADSFVLSTSEIAANKAKSDAGDKDAAFSLYRHYMFGMCSESEGRFWLKRAVALGHELAKQNESALESE